MLALAVALSLSLHNPQVTGGLYTMSQVERGSATDQIERSCGFAPAAAAGEIATLLTLVGL